MIKNILNILLRFISLISGISCNELRYEIRENTIFLTFKISMIMLIALLIIWIIKSAIYWSILNAVFVNNIDMCKIREGACWPIIYNNLWLFLNGPYPRDEIFRIIIAWSVIIIDFAIFIIFSFTRYGSKLQPGKKSLIFIAISPVIIIYCIIGDGVYLRFIPPYMVGGLIISLCIAIITPGIAIPIACMIAITRMAKNNFINIILIPITETLKGIPIVAILLLMIAMLSLFGTDDYRKLKLLLAIIGIAISLAVYLSEIIRGSLQAVDYKQYEAAIALGLNKKQSYTKVIFRQALNTAIPGMSYTLASFVKDITMLNFIGVFDALSSSLFITSMHYAKYNIYLTAIIFSAISYWFILFILFNCAKSINRKTAIIIK